VKFPGPTRRRRNGLMAVSVIGGSCLEVEVCTTPPSSRQDASPSPDQLQPTPQRSPARAGSFVGPNRTFRCIEVSPKNHPCLLGEGRLGQVRRIRYVEPSKLRQHAQDSISVGASTCGYEGDDLGKAVCAA
jgi:hypothetical protein